MGDEILERNKNLNRGFRKLRVMNPFGTDEFPWNWDESLWDLDGFLRNLG